ncbi:SLBB domain-containing protein [Pseudoalteromonas sp. BZB3]|uniref:polysaccharide biosynthesis/export family protein n=1 Tax=Pseudoalteromonas sp. BZB3 TaxID=3136670 RepID=UPI0032C3EB7F
MFFKRVFVLILMLFSSVSLAFTPTQAQIEQFKKLPKAQQEALAKQYGINLSSLTSVSQQSQAKMQTQPSVSERESGSSEKENEAERLNPIDEPLKPFGYNLFSGTPTTFAPPENAAVPDTYVLGKGDVVNVNFYGKESVSHSLKIDNEGRLSIPNFSPEQVAGLRYGEFKKLIQEKIQKEAIGLNVFVSMSQLNPMRILVVGEAYKPGSFMVSPLSTVTHALYASGGLTDIASLRNIQVKRNGKTVATLDLYDLLLDGNTEGDINLRSGDVVFIPSVGPQITVKGAVKREGIFELTQEDDQASLMKMFGGFKENAFTKNVAVRRIVDGAKSRIVSADFSNFTSGFKPKAGDQLTVKEVSEVVTNSVTLIGAVVRPGSYEWYEGITIDKLFLNFRDDLLPQADFNYSIIVREKSALGEIEVFQFSLSDALQSKNVALEKNDEIYIFSRFQKKNVEELALENLALTEEQKRQQEKVKLWHVFEFEQFKNTVQLSNEISKNKFTNFNTPEDKMYASFSRKKLLKPVLKRLEFQSSNLTKSRILEVRGQVRFPGKYPLSCNSTVEKAIKAAGGLLESAFTEKAELTRFINTESSLFEHLQIDINDEKVLAMQLEGKDTLNVLMQPNWQDDYKVNLAGEVRFPGTYTVNRGETLYDVIERAGGLSAHAEPKAAIFTRLAIKKQEQAQLSKLSDELRREIASKSFQQSVGGGSSINYDEMSRLLSDLANVEAVGRLVIDLPDILQKEEFLILQDGDSLYVPGRQDSISIIGEVNYSSSHLYKAGVSIEQYLELSGGIRDRANEEQIYVIKANGAVFIPKSSGWFSVNYQSQLEPGDTIVVPMDPSHMDNLTLWNTATQIFFQLTAGLAAISGI